MGGHLPRTAAAGRPRVLVVEDEALPALEMASVLNDAGFDVVGPVAFRPRGLPLPAGEFRMRCGRARYKSGWV